MSLPDSPPPATDILRTIARASHDLRQPFSSMAIFLHLLEQELTTPRQRQIASRLRESVESGRDLLNALLDLAALDAGPVAPAPTPVPLEDLQFTIYNQLGIDANTELVAFGTRPIEIIKDGTIVKAILA
jgi:signal transduction histidine kinase